MIKTDIPHVPVMANQVLQYLNLEANHRILDMTFGAGGHSEKILKSTPNIHILALDRDPTAYAFAIKLAEKYPNQITPLLGRFSELPTLLKKHNIKPNSLDGILCDFGCSSMQFDTATRGFSISKNGPLDMRMDQSPETPTAADVLAHATEEDIYKIIKVYGEEKRARSIAKAIVEARSLYKKLETTEELADLVDSVFTGDFRKDALQRPTHNATKTFQALRIFVNNELNEINYGMLLARHFLKLGGRIVTITFHSLEDTIVKRHLLGNLIANTANPLPLKYSSCSFDVDQKLVTDVMKSNWISLTKHVVLAKFEEIDDNPRSRSAKLRAAVRVK